MRGLGGADPLKPVGLGGRKEGGGGRCRRRGRSTRQIQTLGDFGDQIRCSWSSRRSVYEEIKRTGRQARLTRSETRKSSSFLSLQARLSVTSISFYTARRFFDLSKFLL